MMELLLAPLLACLVLTAIHVYLGLHVLARGVIFVDLALAQVAALGVTVAFLAGQAVLNAGLGETVTLGAASYTALVVRLEPDPDYHVAEHTRAQVVLEIRRDELGSVRFRPGIILAGEAFNYRIVGFEDCPGDVCVRFAAEAVLQ